MSNTTKNTPPFMRGKYRKQFEADVAQAIVPAISREEVSALAKQAGVSDGLFIVKNVSSDAVHLFAELIAKRSAEIEAEACAKVAENAHPHDFAFIPQAIRARHKKPST